MLHFVQKNIGDAGGAVQKTTRQNPVRAAGLKSVEETEYSGEDGTGGQKEVNAVGKKERTNATSVAFVNQKKELTGTEPEAIQHRVSSPASLSISTNVKNTINSQPSTSVMRQSSFATPAHGALFPIKVLEVSYSRFDTTEAPGT